MTEQQIKENFKQKVQNPNFESIMNNSIYGYFMTKNLKSWDLRKAKFVGIGEIVNTNSIVIKRTLGIDMQNINNTYQVMLIQNEETNELSALALPPIHFGSNYETKLFSWGFDSYDDCYQGVSSKENIVFENDLRQQIEVVPWAFDKSIPISDILTSKQLKLNDLLVSEIGKDQQSLLSDLVEKIQQGDLQKCQKREYAY